MKRLSMRKIRDALRLQAGGLSTRKIAASLGLGQSTASEYLGRARAAGLGWPRRRRFPVRLWKLVVLRVNRAIV